MTAGLCGTPLPAQTDLVLGVAPFTIGATEMNPLGYLITLCYSCDIKPTGLPIITFTKDMIKIQSLQLDCSNSLSLNGIFKNPPAIKYL